MSCGYESFIVCFKYFLLVFRLTFHFMKSFTEEVLGSQNHFLSLWFLRFMHNLGGRSVPTVKILSLNKSHLL